MKKTPKNENKTNKSTKYILSLIGGADPNERKAILQEIKTFLVNNAENIKNIKLNLIQQHLDAIKKLNDVKEAKEAKEAYLKDLIVKFREGNKLYEYETVQFDNYEQNDVAEFSTKNLLLSVVRSLYSIYYSYNKDDIELKQKNEEFKFVYSETGTEVKKTVDANGKAPVPAPAPVSNEDNGDKLLEGAIDLDVVGTSLQEGLETTEAKAAPKPQPKAEAKARARAIAETEAAENRVAAKKAAEEEAILEKRIGTLLQDEKYKEILEKRDEIRGNINDINSLQKNGIIYKKSIEQLKAEIKYIESVNRLENELDENELESLQETIKEYFLELEQILKSNTETLHKKNVSLIVVAKYIKDRKKDNPIKMWGELKEKLEINYGYLIALYKEHSGIPEEDEESLNNWLNQGNKKSTPNILDSTFDLLPELLNISNDDDEEEDDGEVDDEEEDDGEEDDREVDDEEEDDGEVDDEEEDNKEEDKNEEFEKIKEREREREEKIEELENLVNELYDMINIIETNKKLKSKLKKEVIDKKAHISYKTTDSNPITEQESENIFNELNTFYHKHSSVQDKYFQYNLTSKGYINKININLIDINEIEKDIAELKVILQKKDRFEELLNILVPGYNDGVIATIKKTARRVLRAFKTDKTDKTVKTDKNVNEGNDGNETSLENINLYIELNLRNIIAKIKNNELELPADSIKTLAANKREATEIIEQLKEEEKKVLEAKKIYEDLMKVNTDNKKDTFLKTKLAAEINVWSEENKNIKRLKQSISTNLKELEKNPQLIATKAKIDRLIISIYEKKTDIEKIPLREKKKGEKKNYDKLKQEIIDSDSENTRLTNELLNSEIRQEDAKSLIDRLKEKSGETNKQKKINNNQNFEIYISEARQNLQKAEVALEKINKEKMPRLQELNTYFENLNKIPTIEPVVEEKKVEGTLHTISESDSHMPPPEEAPPQDGGKLAKYKSTRDEVYILYKKRRYKKTVYVKENTKTKYCKINNKFYMLSKLKVIG